MSEETAHTFRRALRGSGRLVRMGALAAATLVRTSRPRSEEGGIELLAEASRRALSIHGLDIRVTGRPPQGPALLVSNHLSYLDPIVLVTQSNCVPISKSDLASWPVFGAVARRTGVLFVERSSPDSRLAVMHAAEDVLRRGGVVLNFPEGTTTDGSTVLPFRKGLFGAAQTLNVPVVPVALRYRPRELAWIGDDAFVPHYLFFLGLPESAVEVVFGEPIPARAFGDAQALAEAARDRIVGLLEDRTEWLRKAR
ncbi:MAG TPA: lysophospholipid acyltransferase family protein [Anaeromyxobacter sp.]|nr:lysophospholipid acyltransferase family protein [Anaeromyxobacter sp.]